MHNETQKREEKGQKEYLKIQWLKPSQINEKH